MTPDFLVSDDESSIGSTVDSPWSECPDVSESRRTTGSGVFTLPSHGSLGTSSHVSTVDGGLRRGGPSNREVTVTQYYFRSLRTPTPLTGLRRHGGCELCQGRVSTNTFLPPSLLPSLSTSVLPPLLPSRLR